MMATGNQQLETVVYLLATGDWKVFFNLLSTFNQPGTAIKCEEKRIIVVI
jgi:hypothetical protein